MEGGLAGDVAGDLGRGVTGHPLPESNTSNGNRAAIHLRNAVLTSEFVTTSCVRFPFVQVSPWLSIEAEPRQTPSEVGRIRYS